MRTFQDIQQMPAVCCHAYQRRRRPPNVMLIGTFFGTRSYISKPPKSRCVSFDFKAAASAWETIRSNCFSCPLVCPFTAWLGFGFQNFAFHPQKRRSLPPFFRHGTCAHLPSNPYTPHFRLDNGMNGSCDNTLQMSSSWERRVRTSHGLAFFSIISLSLFICPQNSIQGKKCPFCTNPVFFPA